MKNQALFYFEFEQNCLRNAKLVYKESDFVCLWTVDASISDCWFRKLLNAFTTGGQSTSVEWNLESLFQRHVTLVHFSR